MAVLVEGISVVIRLERIKLAMRGGWDGFVKRVPNRTLCTDGELARVGFMVRNDVVAYISQLQRKGLVHTIAGEALDFVVVDQLRGPAGRCGWVHFGVAWVDDNPTKLVAICRLREGKSETMATPQGWSYEASLSKSCGHVGRRRAKVAMKLLRQEEGHDVYWNEATGREVVVARTGDGRKIEDMIR